MDQQIVLSSESEERRMHQSRYRWSLGVLGAAYPVWQMIYIFFFPEAYDPLWQRLILTALCAGVIASTFFEHRLKKYEELLFEATVFGATLHVFYLVHANDLQLPYILGAYCLMFGSGAALLNVKSNFLYYTMCGAVTLTLWWQRGDANATFLFLGAACSTFVSFMVSKALLSLVAALSKSREDLRARSEDLALANSGLENVMSSLGQGFFSFGRDGICKKVHSRACLDLLGMNPADRPVWEVLRVPPDDIGSVKAWVQLCFDPANTSFQTTLNAGMKTVPHALGLTIAIEYFPVVDPAGGLKEMVVVATDKTNEVKAKREAETEHRRMKMVTTIVEQRAFFQPFMKDVNDRLGYFAQLSREQFVVDSTEQEFRRFLHTIKGGFDMFALDQLADAAHQLEFVWKARRNSNSDAEGVITLIRVQCALLNVQLESFITRYRKVLGRSVTQHERSVELPIEQILDLLKKARRPSEQNLLWQDLLKATLRPVGEYFQQYAGLTTSIAQRQRKKIEEVRFVNAGLEVYPENYHELFVSFVHVFRNAVDHGIESPADRLALGKNEKGSIEVTFRRENRNGSPWLVITTKDDGRGIDPNGIRKKLSLQNGTSPFTGKNDEELIQIVFESGFTTREVVTSLSGRGIGLDALRAAAERLGGNVRAQSQLGRGTTISVEVPYLLPSEARTLISAA